MRKIIRLVLSLFASTLSLVFITTVFAGSPDLTNQARENTGLSIPDALLEAASGRQTPLKQTMLAPSTLEITHTIPAFAQIPVHFTATVTADDLLTSRRGEASLISGDFVWYFGDGSDSILVHSSTPGISVISHTYAAAMVYTVTVFGLDQSGVDVVSESISVSVAPPQHAYLPVIFQAFSPPEPDLVCQALRVQPPAPSTADIILLTVEMANQVGMAADGFWVDLYINPAEPPTANQRWGEICGLPCLGGLAWAISNQPLSFGQSRALVSIPSQFHPNGYDPFQTVWEGKLPAGEHQLYAYVDSWHPTNSFGAVLESDESLSSNRCGPVSVTVTPASLFKTNFSRPGGLPARPEP